MRVPVAYVCYEASGEYEDYHERPLAVFTERQEAEKWVEAKRAEHAAWIDKLETITKAESGFWESEQDELHELQAKETLTDDEEYRLQHLAELLNESAHEYIEPLYYDYHTVTADDEEDNEDD